MTSRLPTMLLRAALGVCALLALVACKQDVYSRLSEADANDMLGVLLLASLDATKSSPDGKTWTVTVESDQMGRALAVLRASGLPAERHANLGELFKKDGLISTPTEERVRFIYGVSQELEKTVASIDGVITARVHVVLPNNDPLAEHVKPSSASVFIKHRANANVATLTPVVKNLVVRSVEGLAYENVNVTLISADPLQGGPAAAVGRGALSPVAAIGAVLAFAAASAGAGWFWLKRRRSAASVPATAVSA